MTEQLKIFITFCKRFGNLTEQETALILEHLKVELVKQGDFYLEGGKICNRIGFIVEGVMRYCNQKEDGEIVTCYFISENQFAFDGKSYMENTPSTLIIQALTDTLLITISKKQEEKLYSVFPKWNQFSLHMSQEFMTTLLNQRSFLLNQDSLSRYRHFLEHYPHILRRVPLSAVASFLGIRQQSLSRLRSQL